MCVEKLSCGRSIEFRGRGQADGWTQGCVVCKVGMEEGWHRTGRLGYRGNGTGASPQSEGQAQPSIDPKGWRPWASQVTGDGCQQSWTGGDGRGGSQPAAGRESPTSSGVPGGLADLPDLGWGGHPQSGLQRETGRRRMDRTPGAGAARPWAAAGICPARLPGRAAWKELGGSGRRPRLPLSAEAGAAPGPRSASRALGRGWGRSWARRKPREPRGLGLGGQTQPRWPAPTLPPPLPSPTSDAVPARVSGDQAPPFPGAAAAVGLERPSPGPCAADPRLTSQAAPLRPGGCTGPVPPAGRARGRSSRADREGREGTLDAGPRHSPRGATDPLGRSPPLPVATINKVLFFCPSCRLSLS